MQENTTKTSLYFLVFCTILLHFNGNAQLTQSEDKLSGYSNYTYNYIYDVGNYSYIQSALLVLGNGNRGLVAMYSLEHPLCNDQTMKPCRVTELDTTADIQCLSEGRFIFIASNRAIRQSSANFTIKDFKDSTLYSKLMMELQQKQQILDELQLSCLSISGNKGSHASSFRIHNRDAFSILLKDDKPLFVVSQIGKGRILWIGDGGFISKIFVETLNLDIRQMLIKFLSREVSFTDSLFTVINSKSPPIATLKSKVFIWDAHQVLPDSQITQLIDHVEGGGGLVVGVKNWAYKTKPLGESQLKELFLRSGVEPETNGLSPYDDKLNFCDIKLTQIDTSSNAISGPIKLEMITSGFNTFSNFLPTDILSNNAFFEHYTSLVQTNIAKFTPLVSTLVPCGKYGLPLSNISSRNYIDWFSDIYSSQVLTATNIAAPGSHIYPGDVPESTVIYTKSFNIKCQSREYVPLGFYKRPGSTSQVTLSSGDPKDFKIMLNFNHISVKGKDFYYRWPSLRSEISLSSLSVGQSVSLYSGFGGLVWISCPRQQTEITLQITNLVEAPYYDIRNPKSKTLWNTNRNAPAPWAIMAGQRIVFVAPSYKIRNLLDPFDFLNGHDVCLYNQLHLKGIENLINQKREVAASDYQVASGFYHAGYPIALSISQREAQNFNFTHLKTDGSWGIFHEYGHNMDETPWQFENSKEKSNNLFTILCQEVVAGHSVLSLNNSWFGFEPLYIQLLTKYNNNESDQTPLYNYEELKLAIAFYSQLIDVFGWELYRQVFRTIKSTPKEQLPKEEEDRLDFWFVICSQTCGFNLAPHFAFWGISPSQAAFDKVKNLPLYLPDDIVTNLVPRKVLDVERAYGKDNIRRKRPSKLKEIVGPFVFMADKHQASQIVFNN